MATSATGTYFSASWRHGPAGTAPHASTPTTTPLSYNTEIAHGTWVHVRLSYCTDGTLRLWVGGVVRDSVSLGVGREDDVHPDGPYSTVFVVGAELGNWNVAGPQADVTEVRHLAGVSGPTGSYTPPTTRFLDSAAPTSASVVVRAVGSGTDLTARFDVSVLRAPMPTIIASAVPAQLSVPADWQGVVTGNSVPTTFQVSVNGTPDPAFALLLERDQLAALITTISGKSATITGMDSTRSAGELRGWLSRPGFAAQLVRVPVTKTSAGQPAVIPGGPTALTVAGATDGTVPAASLPVSATVTASQAGTDVATSYNWTPSASSGVTATNTSGAPTVQVTAMATGTDTGTVTMTGTRSGWPPLVHVISVSKTRLLPVVGSVADWGMVSCLAFGVTSATARVIIKSDGRVASKINGIPSESIETNWHGPTTSGIGSSRWAKLTKLAGDNPTGPTLATVHALSSDLTISLVRSTTGSTDGTYLVEIYSDSAGTTKVGQGTVYLAAEIS
jgi:hypothetical protein